jgi:hypothetical protein
MMKPRLVIVPWFVGCFRAALLLAGLFWLGVPANGTDNPPIAAPYGTAMDIQFARQVWPILEQRGLTGARAILTPPTLAREPVGRWIETMGALIMLEGVPRQAFVKRLYREDASLEQIDADRMGTLVHSVAMIQREAGYNPLADDWFFVRYGPDGSVLNGVDGVAEAGRLHQGSDIGCMACHSTAPGDDFLFTTDHRPARSSP